MTELITALIAAALKCIEAHPGQAREAYQIFKPVTGTTLSQDMLCAADQAILGKIKRLHSSTVTIQMDAGTILRHQSLNYVVICPHLRSFLFHAEFRNIFAEGEYVVITTCVLEESLENGVVIAGVVADHLFYQQAGLRSRTESVQDARIKGLIVLACANHIFNLVLRNGIEGNEELATHLGSIKILQDPCENIQPFANMGKCTRIFRKVV
jgi:hypothetical protein